MLSRLDESLAIWGSPMETEDWTTVSTGRLATEEGDPQPENRKRVKAEAREIVWKRCLAGGVGFLIDQFPRWKCIGPVFRGR
jgi:hypothetical protein